MVGVIDRTHLISDENLMLFNVDVNYQQNFNNEKLAKFFSFNNKKTMSFGPVCNKYDIYGLNFGASSLGTITLEPKIRNLTFNIDIFNNWNLFLICCKYLN